MKEAIIRIMVVSNALFIFLNISSTTEVVDLVVVVFLEIIVDKRS
jgi:hypothetical protein